MNLRNDYTSLNDNNDDHPKYADEMMTVCMGEIHDILMEPMGDKISPEQGAILSLIGITLKIIAAKATQLEKMEQGNPESGEHWKN
jgi:hypothetical protein